MTLKFGEKVFLLFLFQAGIDIFLQNLEIKMQKLSFLEWVEQIMFDNFWFRNSFMKSSLKYINAAAMNRFIIYESHFKFISQKISFMIAKPEPLLISLIWIRFL